MQHRAKRLTSAARAEPADPVITYTRLTADDASGRIEPRFASAVSRDPFVEDIEALPQVEAPPSQAAIDIDEIAAPVAPRGPAIRVRSRAPRYIMLAGILALLGGAGVLAATYGGVVSLDTRTASAPVPASTVVHAPSLAEDASAGPTFDVSRDVRVIGSAGSPIPSAEGAAAVGVPAPGSTSDAATIDTAGVVIVDPPQPRLRPATASYNPPQADGGGGMVAPTTTAAADPTLAPVPAAPTAVAPVAAAPAGPADFDQALASVDRILDERAVTPPAPGIPTEALPYPVLEPLPGAQDPYASGPYPQDPYAQGGAYPAQAVPVYPAYPPANAYPATGAYPVGQQVYGPPAPPNWDLAADDSGSLLPRRRIFVVPNAPVPPADIPNQPSSVWGN